MAHPILGNKYGFFKVLQNLGPVNFSWNQEPKIPKAEAYFLICYYQTQFMNL